MKRRTLGTQGLDVSAVGLGCMGMSQWYGLTDDAESTATIEKAVDLGVDFFDTAEGYGPYANETLLGSALAGRKRHSVRIATKFGFLSKAGGKMEVDNRPEAIRAAVEGSLRRLRTDYIDVLYQHRIDPKVPIEEVVGAMSELVRAGKVRYLGLCEVGIETLRRAHAIHPISVLQSEYSLWERNLDGHMIPALKQLGIGLVAFCPLGRGFLVGNASRAEAYASDDFRAHDPRLTGENYDANAAIATRIREVAEKISVTPAQLAIAWALHQWEGIVPIPGTKRRQYLEQNVAAAEVALSPEVLATLNATIPAGITAGPRYNAKMMALIDR